MRKGLQENVFFIIDRNEKENGRPSENAFKHKMRIDSSN
jgi:hypothetical protein